VSKYYVGWTMPDGRRDHFRFAFSEATANELVAGLNNTQPTTGEHVAVAADQIEAWKAATWTP
jgi:hypothetical protein